MLSAGLRMPLVSVIVPVYNMDKYVAETIDSVLSQTFQDVEVIVVDDGSTDQTPSILARYGSRIGVIRQENRGCPAALNRGIREARGQWIAWVSADDVWEPTKLKRQVDATRDSRHAGVLYTDYVYIDKDGKVLSGEHFPCPITRRKTILRLIRRCFVNGSSTLINRNVFEAVGLYDENDRLTFDWDMWLRIALVYKFFHVPEPLVRYRIHSEQSSAMSSIVEKASRRVASRTFRRMGSFLGAWAALLVFKRQIRTFPALIRCSVGRRTIFRQGKDLFEWLVILVNPATTWPL